MRDAEGRKKEASKAIQTIRRSNTARQRHSTLYSISVCICCVCVEWWFNTCLPNNRSCGDITQAHSCGLTLISSPLLSLIHTPTHPHTHTLTHSLTHIHYTCTLYTHFLLAECFGGYWSEHFSEDSVREQPSSVGNGSHKCKSDVWRCVSVREALLSAIAACPHCL